MTVVSLNTIAPNDDLLATPVQENFEAIANVLNGGVESDNLDGSLLNRWLKLGVAADLDLRFGAGAITFSATDTAGVTITHGLGATPVFATAIATDGGTFWRGFVVNVEQEGTTTFGVIATSIAGVVSGTMNFWWAAIG